MYALGDILLKEHANEPLGAPEERLKQVLLYGKEQPPRSTVIDIQSAIHEHRAGESGTKENPEYCASYEKIIEKATGGRA